MCFWFWHKYPAGSRWSLIICLLTSQSRKLYFTCGALRKINDRPIYSRTVRDELRTRAISLWAEPTLSEQEHRPGRGSWEWERPQNCAEWLLSVESTLSPRHGKTQAGPSPCCRSTEVGTWKSGSRPWLTTACASGSGPGSHPPAGRGLSEWMALCPSSLLFSASVSCGDMGSGQQEGLGRLHHLVCRKFSFRKFQALFQGWVWVKEDGRRNLCPSATPHPYFSPWGWGLFLHWLCIFSPCHGSLHSQPCDMRAHPPWQFGSTPLKSHALLQLCLTNFLNF